MIKQVGIF